MNHGRLVISGEGRLFREGLKHILQGAGFSIAGEAKSLVETSALLPSLAPAPNLIVCDPSPDPEVEYGAMKEILNENPDLGIIVLSRDVSQEWLDLARATGLEFA